MATSFTRAGILWCLFLATLLAGCFDSGSKDSDEATSSPPDKNSPDGGGGDPPPGRNVETPPPEEDSLIRRVDLSNCTLLSTSTLVDAQRLRPVLPPAYEPAPFLFGQVPVNLNFFSCNAITLDNQTVLHDVTLAYTTIAVQVNESLDESGSLDGYTMEAFFDNETLRTVYLEAGFNTYAASLAIHIEPTSVWGTVIVEGEPWYRFEGAVADNYIDHQAILREHTFSESQGSAWADMKLRYEANNILTEGTITANRGILHEISLGGAGVHPAISNNGPMSGTVSLDHAQFQQ